MNHNMKKGKTFKLFLMDGDAVGRIKCTLANWTGIVYKIPRAYLDRCKDRTDLKQSGIYFLFGKDNNDEDAVYIGQAGIRKNGREAWKTADGISLKDIEESL